MVTETLKRMLQPLALPTIPSGTLFLLRMIAGTAFMLHGSGKIQNPFAWMGPESTTPAFFQFLAALSEFGGGLAWILGLLTPIASFGIACTMGVATYLHMIVMKNPFVNMTGGMSYELPLLFLGIAMLLLTLGAGKFSLDEKLFGRRVR